METTTAFLILLKRISGLIVKSKFPLLLSPTWHRFLFLWRDYNSFGGNGILDFSKGMLSRPGTFILNHTKGLDLSKIQMPHCPSYISGCEPAGSPNSFVNWQPAGQDRCFHLQGDTPPSTAQICIHFCYWTASEDDQLRLQLATLYITC